MMPCTFRRHFLISDIISDVLMRVYPWRAGGFFSRAARARGSRARGTHAHVRNVSSSVSLNSAVQNLESSCTGCMFLLEFLFGGL
jgi:hypothetical protein